MANEVVLSVVIPAYNEAEMVEKTAGVLSRVLTRAEIDYELLFVDDGSSDGTWTLIRGLAGASPRVRGIHFSRNFGKESAIFAGLEYARGACAAVMDCDLQHPPETLVEMYRLWTQGYQVVEARKRSRGKENPLHKACAGLFYKLMSGAVHMDMRGASDFKLLDRKALDTLLRMPERNVFFRAMSSWIGYRCAAVEFDVREREAGQSKWSLRSLATYAVKNIASYTSAPMQLVTVAGVVFLLAAVALAVWNLARCFSGGALEGSTAVILLLLLMGSLIMISLGIIGYYLSKIYEEIKGRPRYIVSDVTGDEPKEHADV